MKHVKHIITTVILLSIILAGFNGFAEGIYSPEEDFTITEDGAVSYIGNDSFVRIPKEINGIKVTAINSYGFYYKEKLEHVIVPDSVTVINDGAFADCQNLSNLELPMNLEFVGTSVIDNTKILKDFEDSGDIGYLKLGSCIFASNYFVSVEDMDVEKRVKIDDDVTVIAPYAFSEMNCLSFKMPKGIKYIGIKAFDNNYITSEKIINNVVKDHILIHHMDIINQHNIICLINKLCHILILIIQI